MSPKWDLASFLPPEFMDQLQATLVGLAGALVLFIVAVALVFVGWLLALGLSRGVQAVLGLLGVDAPVVRLQAKERVRTFELPSRIASYITFWSILVAACVFALRVMGLDLVPSITARLQDVVPRVLTSVLVLIAGIPIAVAAARLLNTLFPVSTSRSSRLRYQLFLSALVGIVGLLSLEQLGLAAQLVIAVGVTAVGAAGLAIALAFGLGCRDLARDLIVEYLRATETDAGADRP
jgi:hypothetical protein